MITPPRFNEPPDWDAIARHRAGECDGEEARRIAEWLAAHPRDAAMLAALDDAVVGRVDASAPRADEPDVEAALRAVHARMHGESPTRVLPFPRRHDATASRGRIVRWVAGGVAAAAAIGALVLGRGPTRDAGEHGRLVAAGAVISTPVGVRDSVRLPDGTRVILGPASRLAVSSGYGSDARQVTVDGTAWFAVRHLTSPAFTVRAGTATVSDLGTEFTVRTDDIDGARSVTVAVTEGEVLLHPDDASKSSVTLKAGDRGGVPSNGVTWGTSGGAGEADLAWTRGRLVFRDAPLSMVRADLRRWYGVELRVADSSLLARRLTADFAGEPVDSVLRVISLALGAEVERQDSVVILRGGITR